MKAITLHRLDSYPDSTIIARVQLLLPRRMHPRDIIAVQRDAQGAIAGITYAQAETQSGTNAPCYIGRMGLITNGYVLKVKDESPKT